MIFCRSAIILKEKGKIIYFINIKQLKKDIINRDFNERDRFIYMFIYIIGYESLLTLFYLLPSEESVTLTLLDYVDTIGTFLIITIGTYFLYRANGGRQGEDFLGRYFSIVWVVGIRTLLLYFIVPLAILGILHLITNYSMESDSFDRVTTILDLLYSLILYFCAYRAISEIHQKTLKV